MPKQDTNRTIDAITRAVERLMDELLNLDPAAAERLARCYVKGGPEDDHDTWYVPGEHPGDWYYIRVFVNQCLSEGQIGRLAGCLGYSLRQHWRGEGLGEPVIVDHDGSGMVLEFFYDSTKTQSDDPDVDRTFHDACLYITDGTPVRKTDRTGPKGTRLVEGLGRECPDLVLRFLVR